jgi:hypothetical protein
MNIIRDESQTGMTTPCISMIPLLVQWGIKRCNIENCKNSPTTIVAGIKGVPVFGLCESHFSEFTKEDKTVNIVLDFAQLQ